MPSTEADQVIALLRAGYDELAALASGLTESEATTPSGASEWDVSQVLGHLGSGAEIGLAGLRATLASEALPDMAFNQEVWARWDGASAAERVAWFGDSSGAHVAALEALDDATRADVRFQMPWLPEPIDLATATTYRVAELTLHSWDARVAFDEGATLRPDAVALVVERMAPQYAFLGQADGVDGSIAVAVETTEPAGRSVLTVDDAVAIEPDGEAQDADAVLRLPAEAWLRLLTGRLSDRWTPASVTIEPGADDATPVTLDDLRRVFPGF